MTFKTNLADHNVEWIARESISKTPEAVKIAKPQMKNLSDMLLTASEKNPSEVELLVLPNGREYASHLRFFEATIYDPYVIFLRANEQTKRQRTLPLSQMPGISKDTFPQLDIQPKHTRYYINREQQIVHQLIGMANDHKTQEFRFNELKATKFKVAILPCPHAEDESRCMLIVLPEGKRQLLPQNGDNCRVKLPMDEDVDRSRT